MHDLMLQIVFYGFAGLAVISALLVITQNNPVRCVLFLVLTFFSSAVLWILLEAEFLAIILVLVYVGAVMTLFLFVVMMLNIDVESLRSHFIRYLPFALILVALLVGLLLIAVPHGSFPLSVEALNTISHVGKNISNTTEIGMALYTEYVLAFEIAAALLLVAIVSAITLAHRGAVRSKRQNIREQIMTRPEDRIEIVKMKAEKK